MFVTEIFNTSSFRIHVAQKQTKMRNISVCNHVQSSDIGGIIGMQILAAESIIQFRDQRAPGSNLGSVARPFGLKFADIIEIRIS